MQTEIKSVTVQLPAAVLEELRSAGEWHVGLTDAQVVAVIVKIAAEDIKGERRGK
jgi:hypothetical protein